MNLLHRQINSHQLLIYFIYRVYINFLLFLSYDMKNILSKKKSKEIVCAFKSIIINIINLSSKNSISLQEPFEILNRLNNALH